MPHILYSECVSVVCECDSMDGWAWCLLVHRPFCIDGFHSVCRQTVGAIKIYTHSFLLERKRLPGSVQPEGRNIISAVVSDS